jgi:two-component system, OmpR family, sensor histidine kinase MprB
VIELARDEQRDVTVEDVRLDVLVAEAVERARRHLPPGGVVEVTVREGEVVVRDHGPGVPADDLGQIFDRFHRGSNSRGRSGSGLGPAIGRQVAERHGGSPRPGCPTTVASPCGSRFRREGAARGGRAGGG